MKNEPLSNLTADSKKRKLGDEKSEAAALPPVHIASSSPTPSLEVTSFSPPTTCAKGYSKEKYACIKNLKNEPLSNLTADSKKRKLGDEKSEAAALPHVHIAFSSPTPSLEVTSFSPPTTCAKGKGKVGRSVWNDPATAMGHAHNIITDDELKGLSFPTSWSAIISIN